MGVKTAGIALGCTLAGLLLFPGTARADTVYLRNGSTIDGMVVGRKEGLVLLQIGNLGRMEIPEKDIEQIEKNARTGYVDPKRNVDKDKLEENLTGDRDKDSDKKGDTSGGKNPPVEKEEVPTLDPDTEEKVKAWVYDLTRQRSAHRVRAERRLTALGSPVVPHLLPVARHPADFTRIAVFRMFKKIGDDRVIDACLAALEDENRFVRKMAWESLRKLSGRRYFFPWNDDATDRQRTKAIQRWREWWEKEQERRAEEEKAQEAAEEGAPGKGYQAPKKKVS